MVVSLANPAPVSAALSTAVSGTQVLGWDFNYPEAVSSDGAKVWVENLDGDSVTELTASTGALVKVNLLPTCGFSYPDGVASDGTHVCERRSANGDSVTELSASTGGLVKVISDSAYGVDVPAPSPPTAPTCGWRTTTATR